MNPVGLGGFLLLSFLPGAWLAFGLRLPGVSTFVRTLLAFVISPVVVLGQFYAARLLGATFVTTVVLLLVVNLPAAGLVYRRWTGNLRPIGLGTTGAYLLVWAIPLGLLFLHFRDLAGNALRAHTFLHGDIVYALANGALKLEEAQLAGLTLGYPWGGHVHQAVLSWVWGTSPVGNYAFTNILLMIAGLTLMVQVTAKLGGGPVARLMTLVWVMFAVNAVGYTLQTFLMPDEIVARYPIWGDTSVMPWMRKYSLWNQHPYAHGLFAGMLYFMVGPKAETFSRSVLVLMTVLFGGLALIYPTFVPAAAGLLAARFLAELRPWPIPFRDFLVGRAIPLATIVLVGAALTAAMLVLVNEHRVAGSGVSLSTSWELKVKTAETLIGLSPLLLGVAVLFLKRQRELPERWAVLALAGLASVFLYIVFSIQDGRVEYKYTFTAAMCLTPLAAIGLDRWLSGRGPVRIGLYGLIMLFLIASGSDRFLRFRVRGPAPLAIRVDEFATRLAPEHELEPSMRSIASVTPRNTVVVVDSPSIHVPVFVQRSLYAPPLTEEWLLGVGMGSRYLLEENRGYGPEIVAERQAVTRQLFRSQASGERMAALRTIGELDRPVTVLLNLERHEHLVRVLEQTAGKFIHRDDAWAVWSAEPSETPAMTVSGAP